MQSVKDLQALEAEPTVEIPAPERLFEPLDSGKAPYLLVIRGPAAGHVYKLAHDDTTLGRSHRADLVILDSGISRRHAVVRTGASEGWVIEDLASRNGTWVNGERVQHHALAHDDRVGLGSKTLLKFVLQDRLEERFHQRLYEASIRDGLTGSYNQRYFREHLESEFAYAVRHSVPLSLLIFDIDEFKAINDRYGHLQGDYALRELVRVVRNQLRTEDNLARYGGDEFCVTLRNTVEERAGMVGERIRRVVSKHDFGRHGTRFDVSVSLGVATLSNGEYREPDDLVQAADNALYRDKATSKPPP